MWRYARLIDAVPGLPDIVLALRDTTDNAAWAAPMTTMLKAIHDQQLDASKSQRTLEKEPFDPLPKLVPGVATLDHVDAPSGIRGYVEYKTVKRLPRHLLLHVGSPVSTELRTLELDCQHRGYRLKAVLGTVDGKPALVVRPSFMFAHYSSFDRYVSAKPNLEIAPTYVYVQNERCLTEEECSRVAKKVAKLRGPRGDDDLPPGGGPPGGPAPFGIVPPMSPNEHRFVAVLVPLLIGVVQQAFHGHHISISHPFHVALSGVAQQLMYVCAQHLPQAYAAVVFSQPVPTHANPYTTILHPTTTVISRRRSSKKKSKRYR